MRTRRERQDSKQQLLRDKQARSNQENIRVNSRTITEYVRNSVCTKTHQNPKQLDFRGLLRARSRFPEIVENIENRGQRMESLECPNALAKQVLSQLSYTPTAGTSIDFRAFAAARKLRNITFTLYCVRTVSKPLSPCPR